MKTIGVGVVGTGFVANMHLAAVANLEGARLVGVADLDAGRARAAVRGVPDARWTTSLDELLAWPEVDACIVCTPNDTHVDVGLAIARAGKHLLMEKPLAIDVAGADALVRAFDAQRLVLMGAHTHRFYDYGRVIKRTIEGGEIGRAGVRPTGDPRRLDLARLAGVGARIRSRSGGHVMHNGIHLLDLATWWMDDEPVSVYVQGRKETSADLASTTT